MLLFKDNSSDSDLSSRLLDSVYEFYKDRGHNILTHDAVKVKQKALSSLARTYFYSYGYLGANHK